MILDLIVNAILLVVLVNTLITVLVPLTLNVLNYVLRKQLNTWAYQDLKTKYFYREEPHSVNLRNTGLHIGCWLLYEVGCAAGLAFLLEMLGQLPTEVLYPILWVAAFVISLPLLRWMVDVSRNLCIKKDTGDSEKLQAMEARIRELESKEKPNNVIK